MSAYSKANMQEIIEATDAEEEYVELADMQRNNDTTAEKCELNKCEEYTCKKVASEQDRDKETATDVQDDNDNDMSGIRALNDSNSELEVPCDLSVKTKAVSDTETVSCKYCNRSFLEREQAKRHERQHEMGNNE